MAEIWAKPTLFDFGLSLNKDNMSKKNSNGSFFPKNIKNSPLFRKNMGEEQEKKNKGLEKFGKNLK